jgi:hypothetical protein
MSRGWPAVCGPRGRWRGGALGRSLSGSEPGVAAVVFGFAFGLADAVGSDLVHGTSPDVLLSALIWLVLGYAFHS